MPISPIPEILDELRRGRMVILVDDPGRENEGDLAMLAEQVTPEAINFMAREGRGLVCMPMAGEVCDQLGLHQQVSRATLGHPNIRPTTLPEPATEGTAVIPAKSAAPHLARNQADAQATGERDLARRLPGPGGPGPQIR